MTFPLGKRVLKINTVFEADGFRMCLGKKSGGKQLGMKPIMPLILSHEWEMYIKKLESFAEKQKKNGNITYDPEHEAVSAEKNRELYRLLADKLSKKPFVLRPSIDPKRVAEKEEAFTMLPVQEQIQTLLNLVTLFARSAKKETLTGISGVCFISSRLSNWKKNYKSVCIVDTSASGIRESKSVNLLSLI